MAQHPPRPPWGQQGDDHRPWGEQPQQPPPPPGRQPSATPPPAPPVPAFQPSATPPPAPPVPAFQPPVVPFPTIFDPPPSRQAEPQAPPANPQPAPASPPAPSDSETRQTPSPMPDTADDLEMTIVMVRGSASTQTAWRLVDIDGTEFPLHRSNVLGRRPAAARAPEGAQVISLSDRTRVLSRTHVLIEVDQHTLWITDLGSTNGTGVLSGLDDPSDYGEECLANVRTPLPPGSALSLGGRRVSFTRSS